MNLNKVGKLFTSKFVGTGPSPYKKRIYQAAVSQKLRNTDLRNLLKISGAKTSNSCKNLPLNFTKP